jgi:hypothetical protein
VDTGKQGNSGHFSTLTQNSVKKVNIFKFKFFLIFLENSDFAGVVAEKLQYLEMRLLDFRSKT